MLRISEIKLSIDEDLGAIPKKIKKKLGVKDLTIDEWTIVRESIDARSKPDVRRVYTVDFSVPDEKTVLLSPGGIKAKVKPADRSKYVYPATGSERAMERPVIIGFGPCGMFAGLILAELGYEPLILERGSDLSHRIKDVTHFWETGELNESSNVQFGEGGAGAFSDGKLTTQIKDYRIRKVLEEFVEAGGDKKILYKQKPHIGTDVLRKVVVNIRKKIIALGGEVRFNSQVTDFRVADGPEAGRSRRITGVVVNDEEKIACSSVILAVGHSARDTFRTLYHRNVAMEPKPFSIGVRIEHPQQMITEAQYGTQLLDMMGKESVEARFGAAEYKLSHHCKNGRGVYTFCMCPGGYVVASSSSKHGVVTNGMSFHDRGGTNANSALLVGVSPEDFPGKGPLAGIELQEKYENLAYKVGGKTYFAPAQKAGDFLKGVPSEGPGTVEPTYRPGVLWSDLSLCLPDYVVNALREALPEMGKKLKGFDMAGAVMTGVETRSSSPVRIVREKDLMSKAVYGLYPGGEGAGYAGGIVSAAVDGIKIAEEIIKKYRPLKEERIFQRR